MNCIIHPIKFKNYNIHYKNRRKQNSFFAQTQNCDTFEKRTPKVAKTNISFKSKIIKTEYASIFNDFKTQTYEKFHENFNITAQKICENPELIIGEGSSKIVYKIPKMEDFVLYKIKRKYKENSQAPFKSTENNISEYYFGEFIATNENGLYIGLKISGDPYSQPDWFKKYCESLNNPQSITKTDSKLFLSQLKEIEKFSLSAYEDFANQLKQLNKNQIRIDTINPNNILIDKKTNTFNIIDLIEGQDHFKHFEQPINGTNDMIALLLDSLLHAKYLEALSPKDSLELKQSSKNVIKKCKEAAKNVGLAPSYEHTKEATEILANRIRKPLNMEPKFKEAYENFIEIYKDVL